MMTIESPNSSALWVSGIVSLQEVTVHLHHQDNVAIARVSLPVGLTLMLEPGDNLPDPTHRGRPTSAHSSQLKPGLPLHFAPKTIPIHQPIPSGHKVALREIAAGQPVRRYGQVIGFATQAIQAGEHVHTHNLGVRDLIRDYAFGADVQPVEFVPQPERRTFLGFRRADGRVGTRNTVAIISTANCSAHVTREIAHHFTPERLAAFPNVDGVIALTHHSGCSICEGGADHVLLGRTLAGIIRHPNVGASIVVSLGCETNQPVAMFEKHGLCAGDGAPCPPILVIQELGGIRRTVEAGIAAVEELLPAVNANERTAQPISELMLALQCGGSDGWSGVTANPVVGRVADEVVRQGGTVVLAETPEIYGAEHLLTRRAVSPEVGQKLVTLVHWWEEHTRRLGVEIDNNPTPGNKAGGLTTIYEKALGAVIKAGTMPLTGVYDYAEPVTARGFTFMDSPGSDPISVTGQIASGCNLVLFTTGRGSVFGSRLAPCIKISSNSATYERMQDDMDLNAGQVLDILSFRAKRGISPSLGEVDILSLRVGTPGAKRGISPGLEEVAGELLDLVVAVASGQRSKSEAQGVGEAEFSPWHLGGIL